MAQLPPLRAPARTRLPLLRAPNSADSAPPLSAIFNGEYDWHNGGDWWMSDTKTVSPGDVIVSSMNYDASADAFTLVIGNANKTGAVITSTRPGKGYVYTDVYIVVEHQPNTCAEYPSNGEVVFRDISIAWEGQVSSDPAWTAQTYKPACNSKAAVLSPSAISLTWDTA